jgi:hypothetical protein
MTRIPLNNLPGFNFWVKNRWPQLIIRSALLGGFLIAILAGFFGTPVGNRNISIVAVWIAWWAARLVCCMPNPYAWRVAAKQGCTWTTY